MIKCVVCNKNANMNKNKDDTTKHYEVVLQIRDTSLYLHNSCFLDLSMAIKSVHQSFIDSINHTLRKGVK